MTKLTFEEFKNKVDHKLENWLLITVPDYLRRVMGDKSEYLCMEKVCLSGMNSIAKIMYHFYNEIDIEKDKEAYTMLVNTSDYSYAKYSDRLTDIYNNWDYKYGSLTKHFVLIDTMIFYHPSYITTSITTDFYIELWKFTYQTVSDFDDK